MSKRLVSFKVSQKDRNTIIRIAERALPSMRPGVDKLHVIMDVTATHANGNPLRLADLLKADDFNFLHDIYGIFACLNRDTGRLEKNFRPRFSRPEAA